jgi:hypothetical protein
MLGSGKLGYGMVRRSRCVSVGYRRVRFGTARRSGHGKFWRGELWSGAAWRFRRGGVRFGTAGSGVAG